MATESHTNYTAVWAWLLVLLFVSVGAVYLPFSGAITVAFIFLVAAVKAVMIAVYFMHLKDETQLIRALLWVPVAFFIIMTLALVPDIVVDRLGDDGAAGTHTSAH
ncbi:caa(3)-type oxidase subunit IV [Candidatus Poribacteria bacterium]|jgi:caa(3)-type oxidase subunit IV|nr:caa(3)-type oxidase subunit IV [Candidatus Poribacteria bacterium]MBT5531476.1 caa(3)-type oxidase subunit IV [Candidatus Poribacteria bacterium]MBT5710410.1 caa(3)-type oxidase subunit IV [Candidatus Poribacteria bacterium]MBT7099893.1 caa(3)-type oxidase subunit IV [Candidatus Poribacteria bacterium]MBT7806171.1 caa(3)-type oxidase subunit IV [Candidatus Poribacteria bacterium]